LLQTFKGGASVHRSGSGTTRPFHHNGFAHRRDQSSLSAGLDAPCRSLKPSL